MITFAKYEKKKLNFKVYKGTNFVKRPRFISLEKITFYMNYQYVIIFFKK